MREAARSATAPVARTRAARRARRRRVRARAGAARRRRAAGPELLAPAARRRSDSTGRQRAHRARCGCRSRTTRRPGRTSRTTRAWRFYDACCDRVARAARRRVRRRRHRPAARPDSAGARAFTIDGRPADRAGRRRRSARRRSSTPGYFARSASPLLRGRLVRRRTTTRTRAGRAVVNENFARQFFAGEDAIGKRIAPGSRGLPAAGRAAGAIAG